MNQLLRLSKLLAAVFLIATQAHAQRWSEQKANDWYPALKWPVGANFVPSTAINQLEMFQEATFDPETIDRELGWAADIGFNTMRVYLHDLLWQQDAEGFLERVDEYLTIADKHGIKTIFVLFDAVWDPHPKLGPQRDPRPGVHNSGWVQSPHIDLLKDGSRHDELKPYVVGVMTRFKSDDRVLAWDLLNEPGNTNESSYGEHEPENKAELNYMLLEKLFAWAREVNPAQPLTTGVWIDPGGRTDPVDPLDKLMLDNSDIITFHSYMDLEPTQRAVEWLQTFNRPIICTEYMARPWSTFEVILPYFKQENVGAINWGLVSGRSQTIYPWETWEKPYEKEPDPWFHDIFRQDGTPFRQGEVELIRESTRKR